MKFGIVRFPGSNCDHDIFYVLHNILKQKVEFLWHKETDLKKSDFIILPGGFSYGDYLRSGAIACMSPIMKEIIKFADSGGYVLGICNGFQILCESGLLPGALLRNTNGLFICDNTFLKVNNNTTLLTRNINKNNILKIPIAHAEGRYFASDETLKNIIDKDQILFQYSNLEMELKEECNPNGSLLNIAGICNSKKNVFGMMPHPERAADLELKNDHGKILFESILSI
tara:strand:- start:4349 stop:5032 length:684 start_codon:yes stop_codon:yes gene_type:complete